METQTVDNAPQQKTEESEAITDLSMEEKNEDSEHETDFFEFPMEVLMDVFKNLSLRYVVGTCSKVNQLWNYVAISHFLIPHFQQIREAIPPHIRTTLQDHFEFGFGAGDYEIVVEMMEKLKLCHSK